MIAPVCGSGSTPAWTHRVSMLRAFFMGSLDGSRLRDRGTILWRRAVEVQDHGRDCVLRSLAVGGVMAQETVAVKAATAVTVKMAFKGVARYSAGLYRDNGGGSFSQVQALAQDG